MRDELIFQQLFEKETSTYTYLLADARSGEAVLIDPVLEMIDRDLGLAHELGLKIKYVLDTHIHADHVTAAGEIRDRVGARTGVSHRAGVECADLALKDGDRLAFGAFTLEVRETPGHTSSCLSYVCEDLVFTGDALLIRGTGRTDFQQGSSRELYASVTKKIFTLPPATRIYPGHDYRGFTSSTVAAEMKHNPRLGGGRTEQDFERVMSNLKLADPKKIHEALPANLSCGKPSPSPSSAPSR